MCSNVLPMDVEIERDYFSESSKSAVRAVFAQWNLDGCKAWSASPSLLYIPGCDIWVVIHGKSWGRGGTRSGCVSVRLPKLLCLVAGERNVRILHSAFMGGGLGVLVGRGGGTSSFSSPP